MCYHKQRSMEEIWGNAVTTETVVVTFASADRSYQLTALTCGWAVNTR